MTEFTTLTNNLNESDPVSPIDNAHDLTQDHQDHHEHEEPAAPMSVKLSYLAAVIIPFLGLVAAIVMLWGRGISWTELGLLAGMYLLTAIGVTVGYHRLFTHRAFETPQFMQFTLAVLGSMAVEGPLLKWVAQHRRHHQHSDRENDPHSPHDHGEGFWGLVTGIWHAHVGWVFGPDAPDLYRYAGDLAKNSLLQRVSELFTLWVIIGLAVPAILGGLITMSWMGVLTGFLWGGLARVFLVHHVTWSVNSVCHLWGSRPFRTNDHSRNNAVFGILAMGEGWHNNHHAFPTSARHGLRWWQIDFAYWFIRGLALFGLAWNIRLPAAEQMSLKKAV